MPSLAGATQDEVRRANLSLVLGLIHRRGPQSRSEIGSTSGLNRSTVGGLVAELVDLGLVRERAGVIRGVGRPSLVVEPVPRSAVALALDVRVERTVAAVVGLGGEVFAREERRHVDALGDPSRLIAEVAEVSRRLLAVAPRGATWVGTGVGVPGVVSADDGLVRQAPNLGWVDVPFADLLAAALQRPAESVHVRNDADLGAMAEHLRGAAQDADAVIFLAGDVGIGGGVIIEGQPMMGAGGYGGEAGHMRVNPVGRTCRCGARGCWETEIGTEALVAAAVTCGCASRDPRAVIECAAAGDTACAAAVSAVADWLGIGLVNLVHLLNPQAIVLGGHLRDVYALAGERVDAQLAHALPAARDQVVVLPAALGGDATLVGGAEVAFSELLADPAGLIDRVRTA